MMRLCCLLCCVVCFLGKRTDAKASGYWDEARRLFLEGRTLMGRSKPWDALIKYKAALGVLKQAETSLTKVSELIEMRVTRSGMSCVVGDAYRSLKQWPQSLHFYKLCDKESRLEMAKLSASSAAPSRLSAAEKDAWPKRVEAWKARLQQSRQVAQKGLSALEAHFEGEIVLSSTPSGAELRLVDTWGEIIEGKTPFQKKIFAGDYQLSVKKAGFGTVERKISLKAKGRLELAIPLVSGMSSIALFAQPEGARIIVLKQGAQVHEGLNLVRQSLSVGDYEVVISKEGYRSLRYSMTLKPNQRFERKDTLERLSSSQAAPRDPKAAEPPNRRGGTSEPLSLAQEEQLLMYAKKKRAFGELQRNLLLGGLASVLMGGIFIAIGASGLADSGAKPEDKDKNTAFLGAGIAIVGLLGGACFVGFFLVKPPPEPQGFKAKAALGGPVQTFGRSGLGRSSSGSTLLRVE
ncbi:MAG: PEGA domain-containing protein [Myxococcales bacterium]|nr:PEGA domain-containing protein [Myxococcales bacterium]